MSAILVVEDEAAIAETLLYALRRDGHEVHWCNTGQAALTLCAQQRFDLAILDVGLPDQTGFELCRTLRAAQPLPVLFLTARSDEIDRIVGLELGADDYVSKPFSPRELLLRVKVILRRHAGEQSSAAAASTAAGTSANGPAHSTASTGQPGAGRLCAGQFTQEPAHARICFRDQPLLLTRSEYLLLATLLGRPRMVFSREQLLQALGPQAEDSGDRSIDTLIKQLRAKLRSAGASSDCIVTHRGFGYSLDPAISHDTGNDTDAPGKGSGAP